MSVRDGMCLAASGCAIGKHCSIVSVKYAVKEVLCGGFVNVVLSGIVVEDSIKHERLILDSLSLGKNRS